MSSHRLAVLVLAAACLASATARASEPFGDAMKADLGLDATPGCDLCHRQATAPVGAADKPFAKSLEERGLVGGDVDSLAKALDRDRGVDSDGDGAQDLDELSWGGDPNHPDVPVGDTPQPAYGCGSHPGASASLGATTFALGLVFIGRRRRRRARARRRGTGAPKTS